MNNNVQHVQDIKIEVEEIVQDFVEEAVERIDIKHEELREYIPGEDLEGQELIQNNYYLWIKVENQHQTSCWTCGLTDKEKERRTIMTRSFQKKFTYHQQNCQQNF